MEVPKDMHAVAELTKTKGTHKTKASTKDLNFKNDNFLKQKDLSGHNVIQFREFLNAGAYYINVHAHELEEEYMYAIPRCQAIRVGMTINPIRHSKYTQADKCNSPITLGNKL